MVRVYLEGAKNGIVKVVEDDNFNTAGSVFKETKVFDLEKGGIEETIEFLQELVIDLGISPGGKGDEKTLNIGMKWGDAFIPNTQQIDEQIRMGEETLKRLKAFRNQSLNA